jgi:hypothetical protein
MNGSDPSGNWPDAAVSIFSYGRSQSEAAMKVHKPDLMLGLLALCIGTSPSLAEPPDFPANVAIPHMNATLSRKPAVYFRMGKFVGTLEKTTLVDVEHVLGGHVYDNRKDAAGHDYSLCYSFVSYGAVERVWFSANAGKDGPSHVIGVVA